MFRVLAWLARHPRGILITTGVLSLLALAICIDPSTMRPRFEIDPSAETLLPRDDGDREVLEEVRRLFGEGDPVIVAVQFTPNVFTVENLDAIERITERFKHVPGADGVFSLATAPNISTAGDDVALSSFTEQARAAPGLIAGFPKQLAANPLYRGTLVSEDGRIAAFALNLSALSPKQYREENVAAQIRSIVAELMPGASMWITGTLPVRAATGQALENTLRFTVPTVFGIIALLLYATFRSLRATAAALITVALALTWTVATAVTLHLEFNLVTAIVPPLVITIGLSYTIHLLSAYFFSRQMVPRVDRRARAEWVMNRIGVGLLLSGTTTVIGFMSLMLNKLPAIKEFAVLSSIGTFYVALLTFVLLPTLLNALGCAREAPPIGQKLFARWGETLAAFDTRWRTPILVVAVALVPLNLWFASHIRTGADFIDSFDPKSEIRQDFETINTAFNGANVLTIFVDTHVNDALTDPAQIKPLDELETWLRAQPEVGGVVSYVDHLKLLNKAEPERRGLLRRTRVRQRGEAAPGLRRRR